MPGRLRRRPPAPGKGRQNGGATGAQGARQVGPSPALPPVTPLAKPLPAQVATWAEIAPPPPFTLRGFALPLIGDAAETGGLVRDPAEGERPNGGWVVAENDQKRTWKG